MAAVRATKGATLKKGPDGQGNNTPNKRASAWGSNRGSPSPAPQFNAGAGRGAGGSNGFPPLGGQANGKSGQNALGAADDKQQLLASLAGNINTVITVTLKSNVRFEGILTAVSPSASDDASFTLKNAKEISNPQVPVKDTFKILASTVQSFAPGITSAANVPNKIVDTFRTDTDISRQGQTSVKRERELQAWQPDSTVPEPSSALNLSLNGAHRGDDVTFGTGAGSSGTWDQFATNEKLFGVTTSFNEDEYTTKLDRSAKDFKEKEKRAEKIAAEINGSTTTNPHIAEERNLNVDDSGVNEEDKYSTVVRSANAYVPPGARRPGSSTATTPPVTVNIPDVDAGKGKQVEIPKVAVNGPDGHEKVLRPSPSPSGMPNKQTPADALPAFRDFVTNEKQRLTQKKQALVKNDMEKRVAELKKFSQSFKLNKPIPDDLVPILAKDEAKQKAIREKSEVDAKSTQARSIGISASILNASQNQKTLAPAKPSISVKGTLPPPLTKQQTANVIASKSSAVVGSASVVNKNIPSSVSGSVQMEASKTVPRISMIIQAIPPFRGGKKGTSNEGKAAAVSAAPPQPLSPTSAQRLNVNASSFRPNPKAVAFTPVTSNGPSPSGSNSSAPQKKSPEISNVPQSPNPFFDSQVVKRSQSVSVKDDFNPFKHGKVQETKYVGPNWPYTGKRYLQTFPPPPAPPAPQASPHMAPHGPVPPPPPSYDEDAAAQAASRGYAVYAYAPYGYPGQHPPQMMAAMPGMPPGAFVPSPYNMQHMPYPPNMPPPNGQPMYAPPPMGQMPPPQQYMAPPPGPYPPPPNGGGRPSMPPTPIPSHAHPYYHQSPQMQHAVPYSMMMAPPPPGPNGPPMQYEAGPPPPQVPMGGVGHA